MKTIKTLFVSLTPSKAGRALPEPVPFCGSPLALTTLHQEVNPAENAQVCREQYEMLGRYDSFSS